MPSHSPYALYSLTFLKGFLKNYIRILREFSKLMFYPLRSSSKKDYLSEKPSFSTFFDNSSLSGFDISFNISFTSYLFSIIVFTLFSFQGTISEYWFDFFLKSGGDEENRTPDPLLARQVLSQLSYTPIFLLWWA